MGIREFFLGRIVAPGIARCLTGNTKDLRRLFILRKVPYPSPVLRAFLRRLERDLDEGGGIGALLLRVGKQANRICRRRLIENLAVNWVVRGAKKRIALRKHGWWVPFFIAVSPTMRCNLQCVGCYSGLYSKTGELSKQELDNIVTQCRDMGIHFVVVTGGEPFLLKDELLQIFDKHRDIFFLTFTNGTMIDDTLASQLADLGNVAPAISVEGYRDETDARRGRGVHDKVVQAIERLNGRGVLFGISVTYTSSNVDVVTTDDFVKYYMDKGALFAWYFMFMPIGKDPVLALVPSPEQRLRCGARVAALRKRYPMFMADFWNDGPAVGGCLGAARRYLHVLNSGRIEPCVFTHFGADNIREKSLVEAANSPFFKAMRRAFPYNETGNLKRPCVLLDNPQVLRRLIADYLIPAGHSHSEDLIRDPAVIKWVDEYSEQLKAMTEQEWLRIIEDPNSRWYKKGAEYQNLFQFQHIDVPINAVRTRS